MLDNTNLPECGKQNTLPGLGPFHPSDITLRSFQPGDERAFRELNEEWISAYFTIEEKERAILDDPTGTVLRPGGHIFMAIEDSKAVGCCALRAMGPGTFEVAKMAVTPRLRGRGIGRKILEYVVDQARKLGATRLYLETNSKLRNAIHLYEAIGFAHIPPERIQPSVYARADVYMEMSLL